VTFEDALTFTGGAAVYASGSPFAAITMRQPGGRLKTLRPAQANNCFVFPGLAQGILASGVRHVDDRLLLGAAEAIAGAGADILHLEASSMHMFVPMTCGDSANPAMNKFGRQNHWDA
jgi:malate dehydrogenase (oxaloacetate-decarboxylating)(NADP+)